MSTQTNVIAAISERLEERGLRLVQDGEYGNTGTVYATEADGLGPVGDTLWYEFHVPREISFDTFGTRWAPTETSTNIRWSGSDPIGTNPLMTFPETLDQLVAEVVEALAGPSETDWKCHDDYLTVRIFREADLIWDTLRALVGYVIRVEGIDYLLEMVDTSKTREGHDRGDLIGRRHGADGNLYGPSHVFANVNDLEEVTLL